MSTDHRSHIFSKIYSENLWKGNFSRSGPGSEGVHAQQKKYVIEKIIQDYSIKTVLDIGCGDFYWMKDITGNLQRYVGIDIVPELIDKLKKTYETDSTLFHCVDLCEISSYQKLEYETFDLILCLDLFGHLLIEELNSILRYICINAPCRYLLASNRKDDFSDNYLSKGKTRSQGINIEMHPAYKEGFLKKVVSFGSKWPDDEFVLYEINKNCQHIR